MTVDEIRELLAVARVIDHKFHDLDDPIKMQQAVDSWIEILPAEIPLPFATKALRQHYARLARRILPVDINAAWTKAEQARREADEVAEWRARKEAERQTAVPMPERIRSIMQEIKESTK